MDAQVTQKTFQPSSGMKQWMMLIVITVFVLAQCYFIYSTTTELEYRTSLMEGCNMTEMCKYCKTQQFALPDKELNISGFYGE